MSNDPSEQQERVHVSDILQSWKQLGEELFTDGELIIVPKLTLIRARAEIFAIDVALTKRNGNITHASKDLDTSRRTIRDKLKHAKRYPWNQLWAIDLTTIQH